MTLPGSYTLGRAHQLLDAYKGTIAGLAPSFTFHFCIAFADAAMCVHSAQRRSLFSVLTWDWGGINTLSSLQHGIKTSAHCCWPPSSRSPHDSEIPELILVDINSLGVTWCGCKRRHSWLESISLHSPVLFLLSSLLCLPQPASLRLISFCARRVGGEVVF